MNKPSAKINRTQWIVRVVFAMVFLLNLQCALQFIIVPQDFIAAYELDGPSGKIALQGLGIAFLMWNATYPFYLANPAKFSVVGIIILVQQTIGLIGESALLVMLPADHALLSASILRFICFDGIGLIAMGVAFAYLTRKLAAS